MIKIIIMINQIVFTIKSGSITGLGSFAHHSSNVYYYFLFGIDILP